MTVFDLPRLNFRGHLQLNPGTANNEDYAQPGDTQALIPPSFPDDAGEPMGLLDSGPVEVRRFGLDDEEFIRWIQAPQVFETPGGTPEPFGIFPAEWNYYGDMSSAAIDVTVVGIQTEPGQVHTEVDADVELTSAIGAELEFYGNITDVNPEGSPPATQFFVDGLTLTKDRPLIAGGRTSKGVGTWINFFRNVNRQADDGAGTYVQHVITGADVDLPGFEGADGVVMRYYIFLPLLDDERTLEHAWMEQYYSDKRRNPKTMDIVGTLAPYRVGEPIAMPPGRLLVSRTQNVRTDGLKNNSGTTYAVALAPAVAHRQGDVLTVDLVGTFPEKWDGPNVNPKYDFGDVALRAVRGDDHAELGPVAYTDVGAGDAAGWLFDFDLSAPDCAAARSLLDADETRLELHSDTSGSVLGEVDYYVVTDQLAVYGEQGDSSASFVSQGDPEPVTVSVYHRGVRMEPAPAVTMWRYETVPIQTPGDAIEVTDGLRAGEPIAVPTDRGTAYLLTFRVDGEEQYGAFPPHSYADFAYPPALFVTWAPAISVRILPNEDYSKYYVDPSADVPVANDALTWDVVYGEVLRTYALLYPTMNNKIPLADEAAVTEFAPYIAAAIDEKNWASVRYMPPTRDLSRSRRQLLTAWCNKVSPPDR